MMRKTTGTLLATLLLAATGGSALAAEVTVMISGGFKAALEKLAPVWEKQTGNHLVVIPGPSMGKTPQAIPNRLARGEHADVVIMVGDALTSLEKAGRTQPGSRRELADSPIGVVVKAGAPLPAIHSADQLRATLLAAPSVAYSDSASGRYVSSTLFHTLGIDDAMQSKAQMVERIPVASEVAKGRYAIGFQQVSELLPVPGVTFVGELPDNLQYITRFAGAVTISADHPQEGKALLAYLASPAAQETIHATGMRSVAATTPVSQKDTVQ
ncbi:substrate-binding domain-containing protein [Klebsiella variicola]|uniref:substrate-binding domain-containing protein n=1 Tax=Klebsiella variicola TaxID=244366 RepID=UPI0015E84CDE|nr:substrate-binding domain-containing protein [Klebsiella variicola]HCB9202463.1 substrate-binding domain-containing protein [Klebsiella variicola]HDK6443594.1 substrate-binding domain-containing protein [Klebsiella variicola]HDZ9395589.1 substrate-binding domain-containing protein [Klebsiella variicola subsp. variicola]